MARSTDWITPISSRPMFSERSCALVNHRRSLHVTFDNIESFDIMTKGHGMLDETNCSSAWVLRFIGTAFLVFIGVGSVPATLIVNGEAPFTMADLGMISLAFGTIVVATVYALGHVGGNHINPAVTLGLAVSGKFPWAQVPAYIGAQVVGAIVGAPAPSSAYSG